MQPTYDFLLRIEASKTSDFGTEEDKSLSTIAFTLFDCNNAMKAKRVELLRKRLLDTGYSEYKKALGKHINSSSDAYSDITNHRKDFKEDFDDWLSGVSRIRSIIRESARDRSKTSSHQKRQSVRVLIACSSVKIASYPWEIWDLCDVKDPQMKPIEILRTPLMYEESDVIDVDLVLQKRIQYKKKPRAFILCAHDDPHEKSTFYEQATKIEEILKVQKVAEVHCLRFTRGKDNRDFQETLARELGGESGWDIFIYLGHSDADYLYLDNQRSDEATIFIGNLKTSFKKAIKNGLRLAILNSCSGVNIAEKITQMGVHSVVAMREKISYEAAADFSACFFKNLTDLKTVEFSIIQSRKRLKQKYNLKYHPLLFRFPSPYIESFTFKKYRLKDFVVELVAPRTKLELIGSLFILAFAVLLPVQYELFALRQLVQSVFSSWSLPKIESPSPPILLVSIDQKSINLEIEDRSNKSLTECSEFRYSPIDRCYLAKIIDHVNQSNAKVIAIDYFLNSPQVGQIELRKSIESGLKKRKNLVLATHLNSFMTIDDSGADPEKVFGGDVSFLKWDLSLPNTKNLACNSDAQKSSLKHCPFAYITALLKLTSFEVSSQKGEADNVSKEFSNFLRSNFSSLLEDFKSGISKFLLIPTIDFSIPHYKVYSFFSAEDFLDIVELDAKDKIIIVAPGDYKIPGAGYPDKHYPKPYTFSWDCRKFGASYSNVFKRNPCHQGLNGSEIQAYIMYHYITEDFLYRTPRLVVVLLALLIGKSLTIYLLKQDHKKRKLTLRFLCTSITAAYCITSFAIYWGPIRILIPIILPICMFWIQLGSSIQETEHPFESLVRLKFRGLFLGK